MAALSRAIEEIPAGVVVSGRVEHGVCATGRIIVHDGLRWKPNDNGSVAVSVSRADLFWFGFYSRDVLRDAREPYDRRGARYLPLPLSAFRTYAIAGYGALLLQNQPQCESLETTAVDDGMIAVFRIVSDVASLRSVIAELAVRAGVPRRKVPMLNELPALPPYGAGGLRRSPDPRS